MTDIERNTLKIHNARFILTVDTDRRIMSGTDRFWCGTGGFAEVGKASDMDSVHRQTA